MPSGAQTGAQRVFLTGNVVGRTDLEVRHLCVTVWHRTSYLTSLGLFPHR